MKSILAIPNIDSYLVIGILIFFVIIETIAGYVNRSNRNFGDWIQEVGGFFVLSLLTKPIIVLGVGFLGRYFIPETHGFWASHNFWVLLVAYLLIDDLMQYWYHRSAHEYQFLWKLHRPHHQAEEMGFFVSYRNAVLYYILMPNIWWIAMFTFLGGGIPVAIALVLKQLIIISSHSTLAYDKILYRYKILHPIAFLWEHIFITPAFHHAHHGKTRRDGISDPNGNYGNMFSLWDQIFGSAKFTRLFPTEYGLENDPKEHWTASSFYPLVHSKDDTSELSKNYKKEITNTNSPITVQLEKGVSYLWCQCGKSKNQPFCDSSHHGSKFTPILFDVKKSGEVRLCNCKKTKNGPFCDDTHLSL